MKYLISLILILFSTSVFAQAPTNDEIVAAAKICNDPKVHITIPGNHFDKPATKTYIKGYENCASIMEAYKKIFDDVKNSEQEKSRQNQINGVAGKLGK